MGEIEKSLSLLEKDERRKFALRFPEKLFVFTKCSDPESVTDELKQELDCTKVNVFHNGEKVYVVPVNLNKGMALKRLREILEIEFIIAAGDSVFDISMVEEAEHGMVPHHFKRDFGADTAAEEMPGEKVFSEELLENCLKLLTD
jgi:hydroxymethylpyrimidine pyrophosphatase-like HAD family hydrolase